MASAADQSCTSSLQSGLDRMAVQRQILLGMMCKGLTFKFPLAIYFKEILDFKHFLVSNCILVLVLITTSSNGKLLLV